MNSIQVSSVQEIIVKKYNCHTYNFRFKIYRINAYIKLPKITFHET